MVSYKKVSSFSNKLGFTIVEVIVVIVVIAILATITIVVYSGVTQRAVVASLTSDLLNASQDMTLYKLDHGVYPVVIDCSASPLPNYICFKASPGNVFGLKSNNSSIPVSYRLTITNSGVSYRVTDKTSVTPGNCNSGAPTAGLLAYYPMNNDMKDYSGNNYSGLVYGATPSSSVVCGAYDFDGINDYATVASFAPSITNSFTITAWMRFNNYSYMTLLNTWFTQFKWRIAGGYPWWNLYNSVGGYIGSIIYSTIPNLGEWHYYTFTYDGANRKIYLDGVFDKQIATTGNVLLPTSFVITTSSGEVTNGSVSDVRIYNRALSSDEINTLYNL